MRESLGWSGIVVCVVRAMVSGATAGIGVVGHGPPGLILTGLVVMSLVPAQILAYSIDLEYGWDSREMKLREVDDFHFLGVSTSKYPETSLGANQEVRLLPPGHEVLGYEVLSEQWEAVEGDFRPGRIVSDGMVGLDRDSEGGLLSLESGSLMGYSVLVSEVQPFRVVEGNASLLRGLKIRVEV